VTRVLVVGARSGTIWYRRLDDGALSDQLHVGRLNGRVCTRTTLSCDGPSLLRLVVLGTDSSVVPPRSAAVAVELKIDAAASAVTRRVNFDTGFYHVNVDEDVPVGQCILTVSVEAFLSRKCNPSYILCRKYYC